MFLQSEKMRRISLYISKENVKHTLRELGQLKLIQFIDLNSHLKNEQLPFTKEILHYERVRGKIGLFLEELEKYGIEIRQKESFFSEEVVDRHFSRLVELKSIRDATQERLDRLHENLMILEEMKEHDFSASSCITGIIDNDKVPLLKRILASVLKSNLVMHTKTGRRTIFIIFSHGEEAFVKIKKICISFNARIFAMKRQKRAETREMKEAEQDEKDNQEKDESSSTEKGDKGDAEKDEKKKELDENELNILEITSLIQQYQMVFGSNEESIRSELNMVAGMVHTWMCKTREALRILRTLNRLKESTAFVGEGYIPESKFPVFQQAVNDICDLTGRLAYEEQIKTGSDLEVRVLVTGSKRTRKARMRAQEIKRLVEEDEQTDSDEDDSSAHEVNELENETNMDGHNNNMHKANKKEIGHENDMQTDHKTKLETKANIKKDSKDVAGDDDGLAMYGNDASSLSNSMDDIRAARAEHEETKAADSEQMPPTYFRTNIFTRPFQDMNDVYGIPSYREINPAPFTIITFPFLFGAMFGDAGHGLMLVLIALLFIKKPELAKMHEMVELVVNGRYMLLMCGLMSVYFGMLYSEFFGVVMPFFKFGGTTYFGVDPTWHEATNGMNLLNSLKMKMSVIIGALHMTLGLFLAAMNSVLNNDMLVFYCKVLPRIIAFTCFAGYLSLLVVVKWVFPFKPSIINTVVLMFTDPFGNKEMFYPYQRYVQTFMVALFVICLPWMMVSYPVLLFLRNRRKNLSDVVIHFAIEGVEFNIGLISNISSYLRIWAVSLAHAQLTGIIHQYTMGNSSLLLRIVLSPFWLLATLSLMIALEGLSSALHAMRLNWIEFNSKFYDGKGNLFRPLNFDEESEDT